MTSSERSDILDSLRKHRDLFRFTAQGLTDEQAGTRSTTSELTIGGLVKHVTKVEKQWTDFIVNGDTDEPIDWENVDWANPPARIVEHAASFQMQEATLADLVAAYDEVAAATDALVESIDLDSDHELPPAPWNPPGTRWSARRVFLHIVAETSQHAGHADIIRESIDGQKSMG
jgi:uncharacterized damage-inducible protein DinB